MEKHVAVTNIGIMIFYKLQSIKGNKILSFLFALILIFAIFSSQVSALSQTQKEIIDSSTFYFNLETDCSNASDTSSAPSSSATLGKVYMIGDSIAEGSQTQLTSALKSKNFQQITINAKASRSLSEGGSNLNGISVLRSDKSQWSDASTIVIELGTNGGITSANINKTIDLIKASNGNANIFWVNIGVDNSKRSGAPINATSINKILQDNSSGKYSIIDWAGEVKQHPDYIDPNPASGLGVHPIGDGKTAFAKTVADGVAGPSTTPAGDTAAATCCAAGSSSSGNFTGNNNIQTAFNFFVGNGLTAVQAAGIVGNMMHESGVEPQRLQGTPAGTKTPAESFSGNGGWGIVQWTPGSKMINNVHPKSDANKLEVQLNFIWTQLQGKGPLPESTQILSDIKSATSLRNAVLAFQGNANVGGSYGGFERPADEQGSVKERTAYARQVYNKYKGAAPTSGTSSVDSADEDCAGSDSNAGDISAYQNPFRDIKNLGRARIDQGVDYTGSGPIYALGSGTILNLTNSGWPGGTFIVYKLSSGPAAGKFVFFAENCKPIHVHTGQHVTSKTVICEMIDASPHIEIGWADGSALGNAKAADVWKGHDSTAFYTAYGENFSDLLEKLGAPPGTIAPGAQKLGSLEDGWPSWK